MSVFIRALVILMIMSSIVFCQTSDSSIVIWPKPSEETNMALADFQPHPVVGQTGQ